MPVISGGQVVQPGRVNVEEVTFTETAVAGTYTGDVVVPAGAYIVDILVHGVAVWNNNTAAAMVVGDFTNAAVPVEIDEDGFLTITSLLTGQDLAAGETLSIGGGTATTGGEEGAYISATAVSKRYSASERRIRGKITTTGATGTTGRTRMVVIYTDPATPAVATKA